MVNNINILKQTLTKELKYNLTVKDIQIFLQVSKARAYQLVDGEIPSIRIGERILVPRDYFIDWYLNQFPIS